MWAAVDLLLACVYYILGVGCVGEMSLVPCLRPHVSVFAVEFGPTTVEDPCLLYWKHVFIVLVKHKHYLLLYNV